MCRDLAKRFKVTPMRETQRFLAGRFEQNQFVQDIVSTEVEFPFQASILRRFKQRVVESMDAYELAVGAVIFE